MSIAENLAQVRKEIEAAARRAGRDPAEIKLVAVSKTVPAEVIAQAVEAGVDALGENRVQEALGKQEEIPGAAWHLIGHLQTNKVKKVIGKFELIHSLDSIRLAREIGRRSQEAGITTDTLVQVNIGREESKFGLPREEVLPFIDEARKIPGLKILGLMAIPPFEEEPENARPYFQELRSLFEEVAAKGWPEVEMRWLSMGMSSDFQVAIEEGANIVRVGTRIFGQRQ